jgi:glucan phosphoethanolaminetransferase (alkaline phosphatase superfamily)
MKMDKTKDIKEELLKQMDGGSVESAQVSATSAQKIIKEYKIRLRRRKWIAAISWLITIIYAVAMHNLIVYLNEHNFETFLTSDESKLLRYMDMGSGVLIVIAILLTYLAYSTSRSTTLLQICARLTSIEEHLKKISENV